MLNKKKLLVAAAVAGLMASTTVAMAGSAFPGHDSMNKSCGMNGCPGKSGCRSNHGCKGSGSCKGADASAKVANGALTTN